MLVFYNFNDPVSSQAAWRDIEAQPGQWQFEVGRVHHGDDTDSFSFLQSVTTYGGTELTVEAGFDFLSWDPTRVPRVEIALDTPLDSYNGHTCWLSDDDTATSTTLKSLIYAQEWTNSFTGEASVSALYLPAQRPLPMMLTFARDQALGELDCRLVFASKSAQPGSVLRSPTGAWPTGGYVGIYASLSAIDIK